MNCSDVENRLNDYLDGALAGGEADEVQAHLRQCQSCKQQCTSLEQILAQASSLPTETPPNSLWQSIESELDRVPVIATTNLAGRFHDWMSGLTAQLQVPVPALKYAGAMALLICGMLVGKFLLPLPEGQNQIVAPAPAAGEVQLANRATSYIEKSKILFLGIVNADLEDLQNSSWQSERHMARGLVREASFLKENLSRKNDARVRQLVEELELILLEIAMIEERQDLNNIELIKGGIDRKGLLLKINLADFADKPEAQDF